MSGRRQPSDHSTARCLDELLRQRPKTSLQRQQRGDAILQLLQKDAQCYNYNADFYDQSLLVRFIEQDLEVSVIEQIIKLSHKDDHGGDGVDLLTHEILKATFQHPQVFHLLQMLLRYSYSQAALYRVFRVLFYGLYGSHSTLKWTSQERATLMHSVAQTMIQLGCGLSNLRLADHYHPMTPAAGELHLGDDLNTIQELQDLLAHVQVLDLSECHHRPLSKMVWLSAIQGLAAAKSSKIQKLTMGIHPELIPDNGNPEESYTFATRLLNTLLEKNPKIQDMTIVGDRHTNDPRANQRALRLLSKLTFPTNIQTLCFRNFHSLPNMNALRHFLFSTDSPRPNNVHFETSPLLVDGDDGGAGGGGRESWTTRSLWNRCVYRNNPPSFSCIQKLTLHLPKQRPGSNAFQSNEFLMEIASMPCLTELVLHASQQPPHQTINIDLVPMLCILLQNNTIQTLMLYDNNINHRTIGMDNGGDGDIIDRRPPAPRIFAAGSNSGGTFSVEDDDDGQQQQQQQQHYVEILSEQNTSLKHFGLVHCRRRLHNSKLVQTIHYGAVLNNFGKGIAMTPNTSRTQFVDLLIQAEYNICIHNNNNTNKGEEVQRRPLVTDFDRHQIQFGLLLLCPAIWSDGY